jgi:hypothetical protein
MYVQKGMHNWECFSKKGQRHISLCQGHAREAEPGKAGTPPVNAGPITRKSRDPSHHCEPLFLSLNPPQWDPKPNPGSPGTQPTAVGPYPPWWDPTHRSGTRPSNPAMRDPETRQCGTL